MAGSGRTQGTSIRRHHQPVNDRNLLVASLLNLVVSIFEFAGGLLSGSLALLSDALHNLGDTVATMIAYLAVRMGRKNTAPATLVRYKRAEILLALVNAVVLLVVSGFLIREAYDRLHDPGQVDSMIMLVVGMAGLLANLFSAMIIKKEAHKSSSIRVAYLHLVGDVATSLLVVAGGVLIQIRKMYWIDPVLSVLISLYIIREALIILKESVNILVVPTPDDLDLDKVRKRVEQHPEIRNMHGLHTRLLGDRKVHLEARIVLFNNLNISDIDKIRVRLEQLLKKDFGIRHTTLQFELGPVKSPDRVKKEAGQ